jgi:hypothetical protein
MTKIRKRDTNEFNITFEGDIGSVDVTLLTTTLLNFNTIIQEVNKELKTGKQVSLQIQTFKPGSYDIFCALAGDANLAHTLFSVMSKENFALAGTVIFCLGRHT